MIRSTDKVPITPVQRPKSGRRAKTSEHASFAEEAAASEVFDRYYDRLVRLVRRRQHSALLPRFDGEDVVQSALRTFFIRVRTGKLSVDPGEDLWTLLSLIALRKFAAQARKNLRERRSVRRETPSSFDTNFTVESAADGENPAEMELELRDELEHMFALLPRRYREIVVLRLEGQSVAEVARQVGCCERTVSRALERCCELVTARHERD